MILKDVWKRISVQSIYWIASNDVTQISAAENFMLKHIWRCGIKKKGVDWIPVTISSYLHEASRPRYKQL